MTPSLSSEPPTVGFAQRVLAQAGEAITHAECIETVMINVGLRCDTSCEPCHHGCSPGRTESMSAETLTESLRLVSAMRPGLVDVTGGEPAVWPLLRALVSGLAAAGVPRVRVRTNLTGLLACDAKGVVSSLAEQRIELLASLPTAALSPADPRLCALALLRDVGYGNGADGTIALDIAHAPCVGRQPRLQADVEREYRIALAEHEVAFRSLLEMTGVPLGGFAAALGGRAGVKAYVAELRQRFNPAVLPLLDCRRSIEIGWNGALWDCDFNLAAGLPLAQPPRDVCEALGDPSALATLSSRRIAFGPHCFACSAFAGSG